MEETVQQETQELEYKNSNEEQGGIRRRLRDRDLLRKRKAEAEEKETNQVESQKKRPRSDDRSGAKKRGRPRKAEPTPEIAIIQEEEAATQEAPAVVVVSEPAEALPDQASGSLTPLLAVESQPAPVPTAPAALPMFGPGSVQSLIFAPTPTPPASFGLTPTLFSPSVPAPAPAKDLDTASTSVQDLGPAPAPDAFPVSTLTQDPVPAEPVATPTAPSQVRALRIEPEGREALNQITIEDLGPDEEEDVSLSQDKTADEDLSETPSINVPEQNSIFSVPTLSSVPPPQEYLPGNSF